MPKLYHHEGRWQVPGQQDRKALRVDLPASPEPLAAWLNARDVRPDAQLTEPVWIGVDLAADAPPAVLHGEPASRCPKCNSLLCHTEAAAKASAHSSMLACVEEWLDGAPQWAVDRLGEQLAERRAEA